MEGLHRLQEGEDDVGTLIERPVMIRRFRDELQYRSLTRQEEAALPPRRRENKLAGITMKFGRRDILIRSTICAIAGGSIFDRPSLALSSAPTGSAPEPKAGVCAHLWSASRNEIKRAVAAIRANRFKYVRWDAPWKAVEVVKGRLVIPAKWDYIIDSVRSAGAENFIILDYGNKFYDGGDKPTTAEAQAAFVRYVEVVGRHFGDRVGNYEIWNEWDTKNGETSYQSIEHYVRLVKASYPILKATNKSANIMAGNFSSITYERFLASPHRANYFGDFLRSDVASYMDGFAIHPYVRGIPENEIPAAMDLFFARIKEAIRRSPGFEQKPIYITEMGWKSGVSDDQAVDPLVHGALLANAIDLAKKHGFRGFCIYELKDSQDPGYGLYTDDWTPKPAVADGSVLHSRIR